MAIILGSQRTGAKTGAKTGAHVAAAKSGSEGLLAQFYYRPPLKCHSNNVFMLLVAKLLLNKELEFTHHFFDLRTVYQPDDAVTSKFETDAPIYLRQFCYHCRKTWPTVSEYPLCNTCPSCVSIVKSRASHELVATINFHISVLPYYTVNEILLELWHVKEKCSH